MIGLSVGEEAVEVAVGQAVRVLGGRRELEEIHDVDEADLQVREVLAQQHDGGQRFLGRDVAGAGHHDVGLARLRRCSPCRQMLMPLVQCAMASSMVMYCRCFCLSQTMTLM